MSDAFVPTHNSKRKNDLPRRTERLSGGGQLFSVGIIPSEIYSLSFGLILKSRWYNLYLGEILFGITRCKKINFWVFVKTKQSINIQTFNIRLHISNE